MEESGAQQALGGEAVGRERPLAPGEPDLPGPFPVGRWAQGFRGFLRGRPRVRVVGEVINLNVRAKAAYFELRDPDGAVPCSIWLSDLDRLDLPEGTLRDGIEIVAAGGPEYFPGSERSRPSFCFRASYLRPAGEGDLLARLERLRRQLGEEGLFEPQKALRRGMLPRTIGVVVGSESAAFGDILAGLERRSWRGRVVLAHPPVQGKAAAPRIGAALRGLAELPEVEAIVVARGGGSLTDLWCFCDEHLCRTVAMLRVPVISAVGHDYDRTLIDDVAAIACSTPTHAAEAAVGVNVEEARGRLLASTAALSRISRLAVSGRASGLAGSARSIAGHMRAERRRLHQQLREIRAAASRRVEERAGTAETHALVLRRRREASLHELGPGGSRRAHLRSLAGTLAAHDPERVLERGYAIVSDPAGAPLTSAAGARAAGRIGVRFADDDVEAEVVDRDG